MPNLEAYNKSIQAEFIAIKDRVRNLINHYPTDGAFKESALRSVLRRHLPELFFIGTGFIVSRDNCSKQIDILIVDKAAPRLFWDGDLVIVTPDAVKAVIEVKTGMSSPGELEKEILKVAENKAVWKNAHYAYNKFLGIFFYESRGDHEEAILKSLKKANTNYDVVIDCIAFGEDVLLHKQDKINDKQIDGWVSYNTNGVAAASFIANLISFLYEPARLTYQSVWLPSFAKGSNIKSIKKDGDEKIETFSFE